MIVNTTIPYTSKILKSNINSLLDKYSFLRRDVIGYSFFGEPIYCLVLGRGSKKIFYSGSIHGNEWIVSPVLMKFIEDFCEAYTRRSTIKGYSTIDIFNKVTTYIVPMINPDGVNLVTGAFQKDSEEYKIAQNIANNYPNIPFPSGWKANLIGVDLNLQFPAGWKNAKQIKYSQGFVSPSPRDFVGYGPLTEPESLAIYDLTLSQDFELIITYHTQGKEIYWNFQNINPPRGYEIGQKFANISGYTLANVPYNSSFAGYKDWFIQQYNRPGYTIEAGLGQNPLPISQFNEIYNDNLGILVLGMVL